MPHEIGQRLEEGQMQRFLVMIGAVEQRDSPRVGSFGVALVRQIDRERRQAADPQALREQRDDETGVHAAGEEGADGHVAHHVQAQRLRQPFLELIEQRGLGYLDLRLVPQRPVGRDRDLAGSTLVHQLVRRRKLADAAEHGERRRDEPQREVLIERAQVDFAEPRIEREERLDFGCKGERAPVGRVVERLLTEMVARREQAAAPPVPEREREHAAQMIEQRVSVLLVERKNHLAVAAGPEAMAAPLHVGADFPVVVDLAVRHQPERPARVDERLATAFDVDDGEAPLAEHGACFLLHALAVGTAMHQSCEHAAHAARVDGGVIDDAGDAAHGALQPALAARREAAVRSSAGRPRAPLAQRLLEDRLVALGAAIDEELLDGGEIVAADGCAALG